MRHKQFALSILIIVGSLFTISERLPAAGAIEFSWAFLIETSAGLKPIDFTTPPTVHDGTALQIYVEPKMNTCLYIFLIDSNDKLTPIFPSEPGYYNSGASGGPCFIPSGNDRFTLVPPGGEEKFYLLASSSRQYRLEELTENFLNNPEDLEQKALLVREIKTLRRKHSKLTQITEKGVPVAGTIGVRGIDKPKTFAATLVKATDFYSKILRLNHE